MSSQKNSLIALLHATCKVKKFHVFKMCIFLRSYMELCFITIFKYTLIYPYKKLFLKDTKARFYKPFVHDIKSANAKNVLN